jgi:DNA-binding MarR family transcriptional regulator
MSAARAERLYFHLQVTAARLRAEADRRCIEKAGITTAQAAALAVIHEQPGVSQRGLARALRQTEPAIATLVRRVIAAGLVDRRVDPRDGRARELVLTESGATALRSVDSAFSVINKRIDDLFTGEEVRLVAAALRRLSATGIDDSGRGSDHGGSHVR